MRVIPLFCYSTTVIQSPYFEPCSCCFFTCNSQILKALQTTQGYRPFMYIIMYTLYLIIILHKIMLANMLFSVSRLQGGLIKVFRILGGWQAMSPCRAVWQCRVDHVYVFSQRNKGHLKSKGHLPTILSCLYLRLLYNCFFIMTVPYFKHIYTFVCIYVCNHV